MSPALLWMIAALAAVGIEIFTVDLTFGLIAVGAASTRPEEFRCDATARSSERVSRSGPGHAGELADRLARDGHCRFLQCLGMRRVRMAGISNIFRRCAKFHRSACFGNHGSSN